MTDTLSEPTDWWLDSMPPFLVRREAYVPSAASAHANGTLRSITITGQEPYEDSYVISATSPSEPLNTIPPPPSEPLNTSPGLPLIGLPDQAKWQAWLKKQDPKTLSPSEEY